MMAMLDANDAGDLVVQEENCNDNSEVIGQTATNLPSNVESDNQIVSTKEKTKNVDAENSWMRDVSIIKQETVDCERSNVDEENLTQTKATQNADNTIREPQNIILKAECINEEMCLDDDSVVVKEEIALNEFNNCEQASFKQNYVSTDENPNTSSFCDLCKTSFDTKSILHALICTHTVNRRKLPKTYSSEDNIKEHTATHPQSTRKSIDFHDGNEDMDTVIDNVVAVKEENCNANLEVNNRMEINLTSDSKTVDKIVFIKEEIQIEENLKQMNTTSNTDYSREPQTLILEKIFIKEETNLEENWSFINEEIASTEIKQPNITNTSYTCYICNESFKQKFLLQTHVWIHSFKCTNCQKTCFFEDSMKAHTATHKHKPRATKRKLCLICNKYFNRLYNYNHHMLLHNGEERPFTCTICNKSFNRSFILNKHLKLHGERPYKCDMCDKAYPHESDLKKHMLSHTVEKNFECTVCSKSFSRSYDLNGHMKIHSRERPFKCIICNTSFTHSSAFELHMIVHSGEKLYKCSVCKKSFTQKSDLKQHKKIHTGKKPYECNKCTASFTLPFDLNKHKKIHPEKKPYKCTICNKSFTQPHHLDKHQTLHTRNQCFKCTVCSKTFDMLCKLKKHAMVHTEERPFKCGACEWSFRQMSELRRHMLRHKGERPHKCEVCLKAFIERKDLNSHMLTHKEKETFACGVCYTRFSRKAYLERHEAVHTEIRPYDRGLAHLFK